MDGEEEEKKDLLQLEEQPDRWMDVLQETDRHGRGAHRQTDYIRAQRDRHTDSPPLSMMAKTAYS